MSSLGQEVVKRAQNYINNPNALQWMKEVEEKPVQNWFLFVHDHLEKVLLPKLRQSRENLVEFFIAQFLWDMQSGIQQGSTNGKIYSVEYGTFGTGYLSITDKNIYIFVFDQLTRKYPLVEKSFLVSLLQGLLGERDARKPCQNDASWVRPIASVQAVQKTVDQRGNETLLLKVDGMSWSVEGPIEASIAQKALDMVRQGQLSHLWGISKPDSDLQVAEEDKKLNC